MAKKKMLRKTVSRAVSSINVPDEIVALRLVKLYFEEIARLGFKRQLDLDAVINSYFYSLSRLQRKEAELSAIKKVVLKEEEQLKTETKEQMLPQTKEDKKVKG